MMPFSPLRTWGLGLLSWVIIGAGVYCIWEFVDRTTVATERQPGDRRFQADVEAEDAAIAAEQQALQERLAERQLPDNRRWLYLAAGIGLLSVSAIGFLPAKLLLGNPGVGAPRLTAPRQTKMIERPDGTRLHVQIYGPEERPTVVFTHGWSLDSSAWGYQVEELAAHYRLVTWDLPGLGQSRGPRNGDYSLEKMAKDLEAVVQAAGKGPIILVGHSIGGMITQTFCRLFPQALGPRVAAIALVHTTYTNPLRTAFLAPLWTALEKPLLIPLNYLTIGLAPLAWLSNMQSYLNGSLHVMTRIASFAGAQTRGQLDHGAWLAAKSWPAVVARGNLAMLEFDEQAMLRSIDIPALVIGGKHDRMTKIEASERLDRDLPQGAMATLPAGHLGHWEQRGEATHLLAEFVARFAEEGTSRQRPKVAARLDNA